MIMKKNNSAVKKSTSGDLLKSRQVFKVNKKNTSSNVSSPDKKGLIDITGPTR